MDEVVEVIVVIPTSPRSLKRSPDAKVIAVFVLVFSPGPEILPPRPEFPGAGNSIISGPTKFC
jgi:hypothetical protein